MARINYREIKDRFTHIDAEFVSCELKLPNGGGTYSIKFYPWWEHPEYLRVISQGEKWGFRNTEEGEIVVTVFPKNLYQFKISRTTEVIDWWFADNHPLLWPYEDSSQIFVNSVMGMEQMIKLPNLIRVKLPVYATLDDIRSYLGFFSSESALEWGGKPPFAVGYLPRTLYLATREVLDELGCAYFTNREPEARELPKALIIDGFDYIIADDFDLEVPDIVHKPEWFHPIT